MKLKAASGIMLTLLLIGMLTLAFNIQPTARARIIQIPMYASPGAPLADLINNVLNAVGNWSSFIDMGVVLHRSQLTDFDTWITTEANAENWKKVFGIKSLADQAGYSSTTIDDKVKLALSNMSMFTSYSLPKQDDDYFWPWNRYLLYGYRYARELNWETDRWNATSGFLGLKAVRDYYGKAFCKCNPDALHAVYMFGTRWHQVGVLMDCFFEFYKLGVEDAFNYAIQEWKDLNNRYWVTDHFIYAPDWANWEYSVLSVFPNVAKIHIHEQNLGVNWSRVTTDIQLRYLSSLWDSPQWHDIYHVAEHHHPENNERHMYGTGNAWILLHTFYKLFNSGNQTQMHKLLEGIDVTETWKGLNESDLTDSDTFQFRWKSGYLLNDGATAQAALLLFLMGISPQTGSLAIPLFSDRHCPRGGVGYRHFEFDYSNRTIKIPVWKNTTLKFLYGSSSVEQSFSTSGIYKITFASNWNSITEVTKVWGLYPDQYYLESVQGYTLDISSIPTSISFTINGTSKTTPYSETLVNETYEIVFPETHDGYVWFHWLEDDDPNRTKTVTMDTNITLTAVYTSSTPVGGIYIPVNKLELLTSYIRLTILLAVAVMTVGYVKKRKRERFIS